MKAERSAQRGGEGNALTNYDKHLTVTVHDRKGQTIDKRLVLRTEGADDQREGGNARNTEALIRRQRHCSSVEQNVRETRTSGRFASIGGR